MSFSGYKIRSFCLAALLLLPASVYAADSSVSLPLSRSSLLSLKSPIKEVVIADPAIVDVYAHNATTLTLIGKSVGRTTVRLLDADGKVSKSFEVEIGYDLPAIRKALKAFLPDESIGVEMVNTSVALTGQVRSAASTDTALRIVQDYVDSEGAASSALAGAAGEGGKSKVVNMLKMVSGQQVMLRVRVSEVSRDALKNLGIDPALVLANGSGNLFSSSALGSSMAGIASDATASYFVPDTSVARGTSIFGWQNRNSGNRLGATLSALEQDGLVKTLAEPNLVAVSGEKAEFLAGGEIPIATAQPGASGAAPTLAIEFKPIGVHVQFTPNVLSENRIRMSVQPEVSEVSTANAVVLSGFSIPSITTRRASTTVELAPGESFMIAGLIKDNTSSTIDQIPGVKDLPVLGALFRSTKFQRHETELVISVTPYIVDPLKHTDVKLPSDDFRPASQMEMFFFGALGGLSSEVRSGVQMPRLEGPTGFMVD